MFQSIIYFVGLIFISMSIAALSSNNGYGFLAFGIGTVLYAFILACKEENKE